MKKSNNKFKIMDYSTKNKLLAQTETDQEYISNFKQNLYDQNSMANSYQHFSLATDSKIRKKPTINDF